MGQKSRYRTNIVIFFGKVHTNSTGMVEKCFYKIQETTGTTSKTGRVLRLALCVRVKSHHWLYIFVLVSCILTNTKIKNFHKSRHVLMISKIPSYPYSVSLNFYIFFTGLWSVLLIVNIKRGNNFILAVRLINEMSSKKITLWHVTLILWSLYHPESQL